MGPQPHGHGYTYNIDERTDHEETFQWGHNLTVMDTAPKCKIS